jgi:hypothetical protein
MDVKASALAIATTLASVESALDAGDIDTAKEQTTTLHRQLRAGLYQHGDVLGLTSDDIAEIDNLGPANRGGEPKDAAPTIDGGEG